MEIVKNKEEFLIYLNKTFEPNERNYYVYHQHGDDVDVIGVFRFVLPTSSFYFTGNARQYDIDVWSESYPLKVRKICLY